QTPKATSPCGQAACGATRTRSCVRSGFTRCAPQSSSSSECGPSWPLSTRSPEAPWGGGASCLASDLLRPEALAPQAASEVAAAAGGRRAQLAQLLLAGAVDGVEGGFLGGGACPHALFAGDR